MSAPDPESGRDAGDDEHAGDAGEEKGVEDTAGLDALAGTVACPWCAVRHLKDNACNWVCCGLITAEGGKEAFKPGYGCGCQFCYQCGKKLCTALFDAASGSKVSDKRSHDKDCCADDGTHCPGGHNAHCGPRWG